MTIVQSKVIFSIVILIISASSFTLSEFSNYALGASNVSECLQNWSFEQRNYTLPGNGVYGCPPWETNNGGWRELKGDVDRNGQVNILDSITVANAFGSHPGEPNWNADADINGDAVVNILDSTVVANDFGKTAKRVDGVYSWYTSGGGEYYMVQTLSTDCALALAGETAKFSFRFYPETVAQNGSINNARAVISYVYTDLTTNSVYGTWVAPTSLEWREVNVTTQLPANIIAVVVIIQGKPNFKAWIDSVQLKPYLYNLYYTTPPYSNQGSDPANNTRIDWMNAAIAALGNNSTGLVLVYAWDASGIGVGKTAYVQFNNNPPIGNSPTAYVFSQFSVGAYWFLYGHLREGASSLRLQINLYYFRLGQGWEWVDYKIFGFDSFQYPNQDVFLWQSVRHYYNSAPRGEGIYAVTAKAYAYAAGGGGAGTAEADAMYSYYIMWVDLLKISGT